MNGEPIRRRSWACVTRKHEACTDVVLDDDDVPHDCPCRCHEMIAS